MVLAVGTEPRQADRTVASDKARVHGIYVLLMVGCIRVVGGMQGQRLAVVIDRDVDWSAERLLDPFGRAPATGKVVDQQLAAEIERNGEIVALHAIQPFWNMYTVS